MCVRRANVVDRSRLPAGPAGWRRLRSVRGVDSATSRFGELRTPGRDETIHADFQHPQRLLQRLLEVPPDRHDLADGLHGRCRVWVETFRNFFRSQRGIFTTT